MSDVKFERVVGFPTALGAAVGLIVASTTLVSLGQGFGIGGLVFVASMIIALLMNYFMAFSFGELATMMPKAGSVNDYVRAGLGIVPATIAVITAYILVTIFAGSAEAAVPGIVISETFAGGFSPLFFTIVIILLLMAVNMAGVRFYGGTQIILAGVMIVSLFILGFAGLAGVGQPITGGSYWPSGLPSDWGMVIPLVALAVWLYIGVEYVCPLVEEVKNPEKNIPRAMLIGLLIVFLSQLVYGLASVRYVPLEDLANSPIPHVITAKAMLGSLGEYWISIVSVVASLSTISTLMASIPRIMYGMAKEGQIPRIFAYLNPRTKTPWAGIIFIGIILIIVNLTGLTMVEKIVIFILAAAFTWFISYILVSISVITLRRKYPDYPRPYKSPAYPVPQILAIISMIYVMANIFPDPAVARQIYIYAVSLIILTAIYSVVWTKAVLKEKLFSPTPIEDLMRMEE